MAYKTNSASNFNFDTTVTINGISYDLLNLDSPINFNNEEGHWNIEVSRSEITDAALDGNVDVTSSESTEADKSLNSAVSVEATGLTDVTQPTTDVTETVTTSDETTATAGPTVVSDADPLVSTSDETVSDPAAADHTSDHSKQIVADADVTGTVTETTETSGAVVDDQTTVATGADAEAATTVETTATIAAEEPVTDDVTSVEVDDTTSEVTESTEGVDADGVGDTAEADLTASGDGSHNLGRQLASWLADLDTLVFDPEADTTEADADAHLPQYADAIADVLGELQTCLATHEASVDPVAAEAVSDYLAAIQNKIASADDLII
jgi:hypothetical protein